MKLTLLMGAALSVALLSLSGCGSEGEENAEGAADGATLAKEVCECTTKANAMPADDPNRRKEQDKCSKLQKENWDKIAGDKEQEKAFNDQFPCGM